MVTRIMNQLPDQDATREDVVVRLKNHGNNVLRLYRQEHKFAGYEPVTLWCVVFGEFFEQEGPPDSIDAGYNAHQPEYFRESQYSLAYEALHTRYHSQYPAKATNLGEPIDNMLTEAWYRRKVREQVEVNKEAQERGFQLPTVIHRKPIPPNSNPFHYDLSSMGTMLMNGWTIMHEGSGHEENPRAARFFVLVNTRTGQHIRIDLVPPTKYVYRNLPCTDAPDDWCVYGRAVDGSGGVLEWCTDEKDARAKFLEMMEYKGDFKELQVMRFNDPKSKVMEWHNIDFVSNGEN